MIGEDARGRTPDGYLGPMPYSVNVYTTPYLARGMVLKSSVPGVPGVFMHPLTFMDALSADGQHAAALSVLAAQHVATVDRRLRAVGL